jgi:hypothetical protein
MKGLATRRGEELNDGFKPKKQNYPSITMLFDSTFFRTWEEALFICFLEKISSQYILGFPSIFLLFEEEGKVKLSPPSYRVVKPCWF